MSPLASDVLSTFLPYLATALGSALSLVAIWAVKQLGAKFGIQNTTAVDSQLWAWCHQGVAYAEEQALKAVKAGQAAPAGADKLATALTFVSSLVAQNGWDKVGEEKLTQLIESALHVQRPVDSVGSVQSAAAVSVPK
jgi:hypothetical protein